MKYVIASLLTLMYQVVMAQASPTDPTAYLRLNNLNNPSTGPLILRIDTRYEGQHGSPYLLTDWSNGQVSLTNGKQYKDVSLKFDAYRQELILLRPASGNDSIIIARPTVNRFLLTRPDGQAYLFGRYPTANIDDETIKNGYFLILYEGKSSLLKRVAKTFKAADYQGAYSANVRYDSFDDSFSYYLLKPDKSLTKVKLSKKTLLEAMSDKGDALKKFADGQKSAFKTEEDAVTLIKQYDTL